MAKKKLDKPEDDFFTSIAQETGGDLLSDRTTANFFLDTGSLATNYILSGKFVSGGLPGGKIIEVYGPSSSGKSYLAANAIFGCQKINGISVILDCENATNGEFMQRTSHLNLKQVLRYTPESLERAFRKMHVVINAIRSKDKHRPILFIYDSISVSPCERELKENDLPENYKASDWKKIVGRKEQPGERAKVCGSELRKIQSILEEKNVTLLIINQTREKIGVLYGSPETTAAGGRALPFYAALRFRTQTKKKIENKKLDSFAGVNMLIKNVKNRLFRPFIESEGIKLFFDHGIDPISGILSLLVQAERVQGHKGNYSVNPEYLGPGLTEYKFKASKENNCVPLQVLLDCPSLVDANSREELEEYLAPFANAINASNSEDFDEKSLSFDDEENPIDEDMTEEVSELE